MAWANQVATAGLIVVVTLGLGAGCSRSKSDGKRDGKDQATPSATPPATEQPRANDSAEIKRMINAVCKCTDRNCLAAATAGVSGYMKQKMQNLSPAKKSAWMQSFQTQHKAAFARADVCRKKIRNVKDGTNPLDMPSIQKQLNKFADQMCACKKIDCGKAVNKQLSEWALRYFKDKVKPTKEQMATVAASQKRYGDCFRAQYKASLGKTATKSAPTKSAPTKSAATKSAPTKNAPTNNAPTNNAD